MHTVEQMLETYPQDLGNIDRAKLSECIQACFECAQTCIACADACLSEDSVADLTKCIRANLDCADICTTTGSALSRHTGYEPMSRGPSLKPAQQPARRAATAARNMPRCMNTAASAPRRAGGASRRAAR